MINYFAALRFVEKNADKKALSHEDIFRLHKIIAGDVMDQYKSITPPEIWAALGVTKQGTMKLMQPLLDAGLIRRVGTRKSGRYILA